MKFRIPYIAKVMVASVLSILFVSVGTVLAGDFGLSNVAQSGIGLSNEVSIIEIIARIIRILLGLLGIVVVGLFLYAGFTWMTAAGNSDKIDTAKKIMFNAVVGLVIIFSSFAITTFVIGRLSEATNSNYVPPKPPPPHACDLDSPLYDVEKCRIWCIDHPLDTSCFDRDFFVKSITPSTEEGDNAINSSNVQIRVVLSSPILLENLPDAVSLTKDGTDVPGELSLDDSSARLIHFVPTTELEVGKYQITVSDKLKNVLDVVVDEDYTDRRGVLYPLTTTFTVGATQLDDIAPVILEATLNESSNAQSVYIGNYLNFEVTVDDLRDALVPYGGVGYVKIETTADKTIAPVIIGPKVRNTNAHTHGSSEEFSGTYTRAITTDQFTAGETYEITATVYDLQSDTVNADASVSIAFTVYEWHCDNDIQDEDETGINIGGSCGGGDGDACTTDADCSPYMKCSEDNVCVPVPEILDIDPDNAASENWVTISGRNFGDEPGKIEFGVIQDDESIIWIEASRPGLADCPVSDVWHNTWTIVTVPDAEFAIGEVAGVRVTTLGGVSTSDFDTDDTFNDRGPEKRFTKSDVERPGLCTVSTLGEGSGATEVVSANVGEPGALAYAYGRGFENGISIPLWGSLASEITRFSASSLLETRVPNALGNGRVGVSIQNGEEGPRSNGVPFIVQVSPNDADPIITTISPEQTTNGSYVTLSGAHFGEITGIVYLGSSPDVVRACAVDATGACEVLVVDLPEQCSNTWRDTEVVLQVLDEGRQITPGTYSLLLKTATDRITDGNDVLIINDGEPSPSICAISPNSGPAPLPDGDTLNIFGINLKGSESSKVFFWNIGGSTASSSVEGWLSSDNHPDGTTIQGAISDTIITSTLPLVDGISIPSSEPVPIRVMRDGVELSNAIVYTVNACDPATFNSDPENLDAIGYQCCAEGTETGRIKKNSYLCEGAAPRTAGYVWRFSSGIIPSLPYVVQSCKVGNLPTPSPTDKRDSGGQACINALVVVQFSEPMLASTIDEDSVRMYECSRKGGDCETTNLAKDLEFDGDRVLRIYDGGNHDNDLETPDNTLTPDKWYTIELDSSITSFSEIKVAGKTVPITENLKTTARCADGVAFCFDFRASERGARCNIENAYIVPNKRTTNVLGPLEVRDNVLQQFQVYGQADQECIALDVSDLNWDWNAYNLDFSASIDESDISIEDVYLDTEEELLANDIKTLDIQDDVLDAQPVKLTATISEGIDGVVAVDECVSGPRENLSCSEDVDCEDTVSCVPNRYLSYCFDKVETYGFLCLDSTTCEEGHICETRVEEDHIATGECTGGTREGMACPYFGDDRDLTFCSVGAIGGATGTCEPYDSINVCEGTTGACEIDADCTIEHACEEGFQSGSIGIRSATGTADITITIGDPAPNNFWPNCAAACTNAEIGIQFNRNMVTSTFIASGAAQLYICNDGEVCTSASSTGSTVNLNSITPRGFTINPSPVLARNTWYKVVLGEGITSIGGYNDDGSIVDGDTIDPFDWRFKTKDTFDGCFINTIDIDPSSYVAQIVGEKNIFSVYPYGTPDVCSPYGQQLNPWNYDWSWNIENEFEDAGTVAILSNFDQAPAPALGCTESCLPVGSSVSRGAGPSFVCGNGIIEPGETCDIGMSDDESAGGLIDIFDESGAVISQGYEAGTTCTYSCQRPGNSNTVSSTDGLLAVCGDGRLDNPQSSDEGALDAGEECDDFNTNDGDGCSSICTNEGSTFELVTGEIEGGLCNGDIITEGEECEIIDATTVAYMDATGAQVTSTVSDASAYCSDTCLMSGTPIAAAWCDSSDHESLAVCAAPITVCGNGILEVGEQCEYQDEETLNTIVRAGHDNSDFVIVNINPETICSSQCIIQNACDVSTDATIIENLSGVTCEAGTEGCSDECTLLGSGVQYSTPSICGDGLFEGEAGIGEFAVCELTVVPTTTFSSPVQIATAVGESIEVDPDTGSQHAIVTVTATRYIDLDGETIQSFGDDDISAVTSSYYLQCGYTEYAEPVVQTDDTLEYNNCYGTDGGYTTGVAENSCCYARPILTDNYPEAHTTNVCRNTLIVAEFGGETIDKESILGNVILAERTDGTCEEIGLVSITDDLSSASRTRTAFNGIFGNIWQGIKSFFARLVAVVHAGHGVDMDSGNWCETGILLSSEVNYEVGETELDGTIIPKNVTSTLHITIQELLKENTDYSVLLFGTATGVKNYRQIPIQTKNRSVAYDNWVFQTGSEICKIASVEVLPESHVFEDPLTTSSFHIFTKTERGERIVRIDGIYDWTYDWVPHDNEFFEIPVEDSILDDTDPTADIGVYNREGSLTAFGRVTVDVDATPAGSGNQTGTHFVDSMDLYAIFCANIWPTRSGNTWAPYNDVDNAIGNKIFNYRFSYCADTGLSSTREDDLPFFTLPPIRPTLTDSAGQCIGGHIDTRWDSCELGTNDCDVTNTLEGSCLDYAPEVCIDDDELTPEVCEGVVKQPETVPGVGHCQYFLPHRGMLPGDRRHEFPEETCSEASDCEIKTVLHPDFEHITSRFGDICSDTVGRCGEGTELENEICSTDDQCWTDGLVHTVGDCIEGLSSDASNEDSGVIIGANYCLIGPKVSDIYSGETCANNDSCNVAVQSNCIDIGPETIVEVVETPGNCSVTSGSCTEDIDCPGTYEQTCTPESLGTCDTNGVSCTPDTNCDTNETISGVCTPTTPSDEILDRRIFVNDKNDDALGIQIFLNVDRKTAREWYNDRFDDGSSYQSLSIDGYDAITNGHNYFVNALNVSYNEGSVSKIYNNIYQFTINESAQTNTREAFDLIIESLEFNTNVTDYGYCLATGSDRRDATADFGDTENLIGCATDFDCHNSDGTVLTGKSGFCSNNRTALLRDFDRLKDIQEIQTELATYNSNTGAYPNLAAGSYYPGYTVSRWPSWGRLQQDIGTLYTDPINQWSSCGNVLEADQQTCWNAASSTYNCPALSSVYEYSVVETAGATDYTFHAPLEYLNVLEDPIVSSFIDTSKFSSNPWCVGVPRSPLVGECGNGIIDGAEACDHPGSRVTHPCGTGVAAGFQAQICNAECQLPRDWSDPNLNCVPTINCGNGLVEPGEECDDGEVLNGQYGQCGAECTYTGAKYCGNEIHEPSHELCDYASVTDNLGVCSNVRSIACTDNTDCPGLLGNCIAADDASYGNREWHRNDGSVIKVFFDALVESAPDRYDESSYDEWLEVYISTNDIDISDPNIYSCNLSCTARGNYCGDGVVQDEYEECDDGNRIDTDSCKNRCEVNSSPTPTPEELVGTCGDGIVQSPNEDGFGEVCDLGAANGIKPSLAYGESLTYCSADCGEVLTADPTEFCGDGIVQPEEACDSFVDADVEQFVVKKCFGGAPGSETLGDICSSGLDCTDGNSCLLTNDGTPWEVSCSEKGAYQCVDSCQTLVDNCVSCGQYSFNQDAKENLETENDLERWFNGDRHPEGAIPKLAVLNPLIAGNPDYQEADQSLDTTNDSYDGIDFTSTTYDGEPMRDYWGQSRSSDLNKDGTFFTFFKWNGDVDVSDRYLGYSKLTQKATEDKSPPTTSRKIVTVPFNDYNFMLYFNPDGGVTSTATGNNVYNFTEQMFTTIETDPLCSEEYKVLFSSRMVGAAQTDNASDLVASYRDPQNLVRNGITDVFDFPVSGESTEILNTVVTSPAVPKRALRVVVRSKKLPGESRTAQPTFVLNAYSNRFTTTGLGWRVGFDRVPEKDLCRNMVRTDTAPFTAGTSFSGREATSTFANKDYTFETGTTTINPTFLKYYWWPKTSAPNHCVGYGGAGNRVYVHDVGQTDGGLETIQSFTIDTEQILDSVIPIFVTTLGSGLAMQPYQAREDVTVEVYEYHENQVPGYSMFKPTKTYQLNLSDRTSNSLAPYWHVFNLIPDSTPEGYSIQTVGDGDNGEIVVRYCEIREAAGESCI